MTTRSFVQPTISGWYCALIMKLFQRSTKLKSSLEICLQYNIREGELVKLEQNLAYHLCFFSFSFSVLQKVLPVRILGGGVGQHNEACACWYQYPDIVELQSRAAAGLKWWQRWWWSMVDVWEFNVGSRFKKNTDASYSISNKASPAQKVFFASFFELF